MSREFQDSILLSKIDLLYDRASMLAKARLFFADRQITEVDCPLLSPRAAVDAHIDLIPAIYHQNEIRYLNSSPEYGMKRLLSQGMGDIYQLSHVFRDAEQGAKHNPEFLLAEWYRLHFSFEQMIEETLDFVRLFLGDIPAENITYREAFQKYLEIDYVRISNQDLKQLLFSKGISFSEGDNKDDLLNLLLGTLIEPHLGKDGLCVLAYYPYSQAALAKTTWHEDEKVAERFEVYYQGYELANGYHELTDAEEQRRRFLEANQTRIELRKQSLPIDEFFLEALKNGLPDCCGVAVGFDRLMMLRHQVASIDQVLPFSWADA